MHTPQVTGLTRLRTAQDPHATELRDVTLEAHRGEILGLAGLVGAGRTELARAIFGADPIDAGTISIDGSAATIRSPRDAIRHGIGLVPEDRKQQALFLALAIRANVSIAALDQLLRWREFVDEHAETDLIEQYRGKLNIRMTGPEQPVSTLSGGNQQKVVLARWLALQPQVLIVDEPTRGIDVQAKQQVHQLLRSLAQQGIAIMMISSDLAELQGSVDRILVMRRGTISGSLPASATQQDILELALPETGKLA